MAMDMLIAPVKGIVNSCILFDPEENLALANPVEYAEKLKAGKLKSKYHRIELIQYTSEKPCTVTIKSFDLDKPILKPFTVFNELCKVSPWGVGGRNGYTVTVFDGELMDVQVSATPARKTA